MNGSIAELDKTIGEEGSRWRAIEGLSSIKGIGKVTSAILLSVIGDVNDFADEGRLASYFGIVRASRTRMGSRTQRPDSLSGGGSKG